MNERYYTDKGFISKGASLNIQDATDNLFSMLIPVVDAPETKGAPSTQDKTVLSDAMVTQCEGLQTLDQKSYTFNYHRDNIRALKKIEGKALTFLERNPDNTGEKFSGTLSFARSGLSVDGVVQGTIYITVSSADTEPIDDVRALMKPTAIITTPLNDVTLVGTEKYEVTLETSPEATVTATSKGATIATASYASNKLTITGVAAGNTMVELQVSATGEATSYRSIAVTVLASE